MSTHRLAEVDEFRVPCEVVDATDHQLRESGEHGAECFVLWVGELEGRRFSVRNAYVPVQDAYRMPEGLCVTVGGDELHRLNKWLHSNSLSLGAQVHSHPTRAYHSTTDSTFPIVTQLGGLSIVVPDFAERGLRGRGVETYRLHPGGWHHVSKRAVRRLVHIDESVTGREGD